MRAHFDPTAETVKVTSALWGRKTNAVYYFVATGYAFSSRRSVIKETIRQQLCSTPAWGSRWIRCVRIVPFCFYIFLLQRNPFHADAFWEEYQIDPKSPGQHMLGDKSFTGGHWTVVRPFFLKRAVAWISLDLSNTLKKENHDGSPFRHVYVFLGGFYHFESRGI